MKKHICLPDGRPIDAILFDMDGVISDTRLAHRESWLRFAAREGRPIADADAFIARTFGRGNDEVLQIFYEGQPFDQELFRRKGAEKEELFYDLFRAGWSPAVPGLYDFLRDGRAAGLRFAIGSSAPRRNVEVVTESLGIVGDFETMVCMEMVKAAKPAPDIFLLCCERLGVAPERALVLEDSIHGLESARAAGCPAVGFTTMHTAAELAPLSAHQVPDFNGLGDLLLGSAFTPSRPTA